MHNNFTFDVFQCPSWGPSLGPDPLRISAFPLWADSSSLMVVRGWIPKEFWEGIMRPIASLLIVALAMLLSWLEGLRVEVDMAISITRAFLQLTVIGFVLHFIFEPGRSVGWIFLAYFEMVLVAGYTAGQRAKQVPKSKLIAFSSILLGTSVTMFLLVAVKIFPFTPRFIIPVSGMMVGNAMTVTGLAMKCLRENIAKELHLVEAALALGATPVKSTRRLVVQALTVALAPTLDNAKTLGLISLPGAMTGLIMGGASPIAAVQLQIVVMNMLIGASTLSSLIACWLSWQGFFTKTAQVRRELFDTPMPAANGASKSEAE